MDKNKEAACRVKVKEENEEVEPTEKLQEEVSTTNLKEEEEDLEDGELPDEDDDHDGVEQSKQDFNVVDSGCESLVESVTDNKGDRKVSVSLSPLNRPSAVNHGTKLDRQSKDAGHKYKRKGALNRQEGESEPKSSVGDDKLVETQYNKKGSGKECLPVPLSKIKREPVEGTTTNGENGSLNYMENDTSPVSSDSPYQIDDHRIPKTEHFIHDNQKKKLAGKKAKGEDLIPHKRLKLNLASISWGDSQNDSDDNSVSKTEYVILDKSPREVTTTEKLVEERQSSNQSFSTLDDKNKSSDSDGDDKEDTGFQTREEEILSLVKKQRTLLDEKASLIACEKRLRRLAAAHILLDIVQELLDEVD